MKDQANQKENEKKRLEKWLMLIAILLVSVVGTFMLMMEQSETSNVSNESIQTETISGAESVVSAEAEYVTSTERKPNKENKININTATKSELMFLDGIGEKRAESIISYREQRPFQCIEEIMNVKGIGPKTYEKNKEIICVE